MSSGLVCKEARKLLVGANLHASPKSSGRLRPVVVGETLRRLVSKMIITKLKRHIDNYVGFMQVGVGIAGQAEGLIHAIWQWMYRNR